MSDVEARVLDALCKDAIELAGALGLPIAIPNIVFPPEDSPKDVEQVHLEIRNFWAGISYQSWGSYSGNIGTFQIGIVNPFQEGEIVPTQYAGLVLDNYANGRHIWTDHMERITFTASPTLLTTIQSGHKSIFPVSVPYSFTKP